MPSSENQRIFGLDIIRSVAIILVMASHSAMLMMPDNDSGLILPFFKFFGAVGVDLFFVLSGFLIGGIILRHIQNNETTFKDISYFWIRRWFRTLPNYFLLLVLNIGIFYVLFGVFDFRVLKYVFFLQNFSSPHPEFFSEAWSLSIEEYAYLFGPLILLILVHLVRIKGQTLLYLMMTLIVVVAVFILRYQYLSNHSFVDYQDWSSNMRKVVIYRIDCIYYGFFAAYVFVFFKSFWNKIKYITLLAGVVLFFGMHALIWKYDIQPQNSETFYGLWYLIILSVSLLLFFPYFSLWKNGSFLRNQITHISKISYALYLVNMSLVYIPLSRFIDLSASSNLTKGVVFFSYWTLSFILANILYRYFEKPVMDLRNHRLILNYFQKS